MPLSQFTFDWYRGQLNDIENAASVDVCKKLMKLFNRDINKDVHLKYSEKQELLALAGGRELACLNRLWEAEKANRESPEQGQPARWLHDLVKRIGLGLYRSKGTRPRLGGRRGSSKR